MGEYLGGGNSNVSYFHPRKFGEDEPNLTVRIFFQMGWFNHQLNTLPKTNIAPENGWLECIGMLVSLLGWPIFRCYVSFREGICFTFFQASAKPATLSGHLQTLTLGCEFNRSLRHVTFPETLETLTLGRDFNKPLDDVTFPRCPGHSKKNRDNTGSTISSESYIGKLPTLNDRQVAFVPW